MSIHVKRAAALKSAQAIIDRVKGLDRDLTDHEVTEIEALQAEIKGYDATIARLGGQKSLIQSIADAAGSQGGETGDGVQYLSLKAGYSDRVVRQMTADGLKALAGGGTVLTEVPLVNTLPIALGRPLTSVIDALPVVRRIPFRAQRPGPRHGRRAHPSRGVAERIGGRSWHPGPRSGVAIKGKKGTVTLLA